MSTYVWTPRVCTAAQPIARYTHGRGGAVDFDEFGEAGGGNRCTQSAGLAAVAGGGSGRGWHGRVGGSRPGTSPHPRPSQALARACMHTTNFVHTTPSKLGPKPLPLLHPTAAIVHTKTEVPGTTTTATCAPPEAGSHAAIHCHAGTSTRTQHGEEDSLHSNSPNPKKDL